MTKRRWPKENDDALRSMYQAGKPIAQIASALGISPAYARVRLSRLGVRREARAQRASVARTINRRKPDGLATRMARRQGLSPESEPSREPIADALVDRFIEDPEAFFEWLGISLFPYQRDAMALIRANDRTALVWPRSHGKDTLTALLGLWTALVRPSQIVVCVSPSQRQSDLWMGRLKELALAKEEIRSDVADLSQSEIAFSNGSRVYSLPSGAQGSATIRGFQRVSILVVNEAAWVSDETFTAISAFLAVGGPSSKLILISTPFGQSGYLWRAFNSDLFAKSHVTTVSNPLIPTDFIEKERSSMDPLSFASEWGAQFLSSQSAYFPTELVQRCVQAYPLVESPLPEHADMTFYLGCDWARIAGADKSVFTVLGIDRDGHGKVLWIKAMDGVDYVSQAAYVEWLHGRWGFTRIFADASNHAVVDLLVSKSLPVEPVQFTAPSKVDLFGRLKSAMEAAKLTIPSHPDLLRELSTFEYRISPSGNLLLHHVSGGHDDYPDSLALAARQLTQERMSMGLIAVLDTISVGGGGTFKVLGQEPPPGETDDRGRALWPLDTGIGWVLLSPYLVARGVDQSAVRWNTAEFRAAHPDVFEKVGRMLRERGLLPEEP